MRLNRLIWATLLMVPMVAQAQSFADYLKTRQQYGIKQSASPAALEAFVGQKIVEVRGIVKGSIGSQGSQRLILDSVEGGHELYVHAVNSPTWLSGGATPVRMIIEASREDDRSMIRARMVSVTTEREMSDWEAKNAPKPTAPKPSPAPNRGGTSRNGAPVRSNISAIQPRMSPSSLAPEIKALIPVYSNFIRSQNKKLSVSRANQIAEQILDMSVHFGVDARLVVALIICESNFDPSARSHVGAQGLGQLMPGTARELGVSNAYNTDQNLYGTVKLLGKHLTTYTNKKGDGLEAIILSLAAYNAGPGAVKRHGGVPPYRETQNYVRKVIATYKKLIGAD